MHLRDFYTPESVILSLRGSTPDEILPELISHLHLDERSTETLLKVLRRREQLGPTGVGKGIAIPHARSLVVNRVRLVYGHSVAGVIWPALDSKPVHHFFLIVAPPIEVSNQYHPVLGKIATFAKEPDVPQRLSRMESAEDFFRLLDEKGV
jgi:mannitol/fructose-specific phosphotransferase system IIA component (Ntr-type)